MTEVAIHFRYLIVMLSLGLEAGFAMVFIARGMDPVRHVSGVYPPIG